jgi:hypothetical protein
MRLEDIPFLCILTHGLRSVREDCTPGSIRRSKLTLVDYILVKHQFRNSMKDVQSLPGADSDPDHNLLVAKICIRLKIMRF